MIIDKKKNCFNFIRILAAIQVFLGHASAHLEVELPHIVYKGWRCFNGVPIFFILSGFLVWDSIERTATFKQYACKRILRIYPELLGGVIVNAILMILLYAKSIEWVPFILFQGAQSTILQFWTPDCLRGYGCGTPNGSLWTIGIMVQSYMILWFLHKILYGKNIKCWILLLVMGILLNCFVPSVAIKILPGMIYKLYMQTFVSYIWLFLVGAFLCEYIDKVGNILVKCWYVWLIADIIVSVTGFDAGRYGTLQGVFLALFLVGFGYRFSNLKITHDISYGLYIYHMIIINVMIEIHMVYVWYDIMVALVLSLIMGTFSYKCIGTLGEKIKSKMV